MAAQVIGNYEIQGLLGQGGMGKVYRARDCRDGRMVALKECTIPEAVQGTARREAIERYHREVRAASVLDHPNIVRVLDSFEANGSYFMAMELLDGCTVREMLRQGGALSVSRATKIAIQIANALDFAHGRGIIHRDVSPDNIFVLQDGTAKLTDFGVAKLVSEQTLTQAQMAIGTPAYMSPEQAKGLSLDGRSDLFSLGSTLYEMLANAKPFPGDSLGAVISKILHEEPQRPPGIPDYLGSILRKALTKDPAGRYQTGREMANDLLSQRAPAVAAPRPAAVGAAPPPNVTVITPSPAPSMGSPRYVPPQPSNLCPYHNRVFTGICTNCGRPVCDDCRRMVGGQGLCQFCAAGASKSGNSFSIAALVLGIVSVVLCCIPILGPLAIIFGAVALNRQESSREMAIAGIILGCLSLAILVIWMINTSMRAPTMMPAQPSGWSN